MTTSSPGPNPDRQSNPSPNSPPGAPSSTPIPSTILTSNPTNTPAGQADIERYRKFFYYSSIGMMVLCPAVILAPPRKFDPYTLGLGFAWFASTGYVVQEHTGKGLMWHIGSRLPSAGNREREMREEAERQRAAEEKRSLARSAWSGGDGDNWIEKRKRREQEYLDDGRGYQGLIMDQIKEVMGFKKEDEDEDEEDTN